MKVQAEQAGIPPEYFNWAWKQVRIPKRSFDKKLILWIFLFFLINLAFLLFRKWVMSTHITFVDSNGISNFAPSPSSIVRRVEILLSDIRPLFVPFLYIGMGFLLGSKKYSIKNINWAIFLLFILNSISLILVLGGANLHLFKHLYYILTFLLIIITCFALGNSGYYAFYLSNKNFKYTKIRIFFYFLLLFIFSYLSYITADNFFIPCITAPPNLGLFIDSPIFLAYYSFLYYFVIFTIIFFTNRTLAKMAVRLHVILGIITAFLTYMTGF